MKRRFRNLVAEDLVVNMKTGDSLAGVLWEERPGLLVLRKVKYFSPGQPEGIEMDGEAIVKEEDIAFLQREVK